MLQCDVTAGNPASYSVSWTVGGVEDASYAGMETITISPTKTDHNTVYACVADNGMEASDSYTLLVERE